MINFLSIDKFHTYTTTTGFGNVSSVGSCVLLALHYNHGKLVLANCGDCRAILGSVITSNRNDSNDRSDKNDNISNAKDRLVNY